MKSDRVTISNTDEQQPAGRTATIVLITGLALIVIAVLYSIGSAWDSLTPLGRITTTLLPMIALYLIASRNKKNSAHHTLSRYASLTAGILFPFAIGVIMYQSGLYHPADSAVNSTLVFLISLVSILWYLIGEFILDEPWLAPLTIFATFSLAFSLASFLEQPPSMYYLFGILIGYFFLSIGWTVQHIGKLWEAAIYTKCGLISGLVSLILLPFAYFQGLHDMNSLISYLIITTVLFLVAILYSSEWIKEKYLPYLLVRRCAENAAAITLSLPALVLCLNSDNANFSVMALVVGILSLALSRKVTVSLFRYLGYATLFVAILKLIILGFIVAQSFWVYLLLIIGFLLIGVAYNGGHAHYRTFYDHMWDRPATTLYGLGTLPEPSAAERETVAPSHSKGRSALFAFAVIIGIYILLTISLGSL